MENILEVEKHPNGTQVYLNNEPYAWFKSSEKQSETNRKIGLYAERLKAQVLYCKADVVTRHFKIEFNFNRDEWKMFLQEFSKVIIKGEYFKAGFVWTYMTFQAVESTRPIETYEDVFFKYRKSFYAKYQLSQKPQPQKRWKGEWEKIQEVSK